MKYELCRKAIIIWQVKLKMGQEAVHTVLLNVIADFPAQCLLTRRGLLSELLNVVGTPFLSSSMGPVTMDCLSATHPAGADPAGHMTPLAAMDWLERLLDKMKAEHRVHVEGSLSSGLGPRVPAADIDDMSTAFRMVCLDTLCSVRSFVFICRLHEGRCHACIPVSEEQYRRVHQRRL